MAESTPPIAPSAGAAPRARRPPSNLRLRLIYGVLGAILLLGCVWFSSWTFGLFFCLVQAIMLWEFYRLMRAGGHAPATWLGIGAATAIFFLVALLNREVAAGGQPGTVYPITTTLIAVALLLPVVLLLRAILLWKESARSFSNIGVTLTGLCYISVPMALLNYIAYTQSSYTTNNYDYRRVFGLLFLIWSSDIGAYAVGKNFGRHKLAPRISPGKTWEGWAGGFLLTLAVGWALKFMLPDLPLAHRLVAAGVVAVFGPLGDLAESMLKRSVGVKDSGSILPGHGGLLDRFDAFLLVLPVLALLQLLAG